MQKLDQLQRCTRDEEFARQLGLTEERSVVQTVVKMTNRCLVKVSRDDHLQMVTSSVVALMLPIMSEKC